MTLYEHIKSNAKLAIPVIITQLGQVSVNIIDLIFIGRLGEKQIASAGLATNIFIIFFVFLLGFSFAMSPLISSSAIKGNKQRVANIFTHGMVLNISLTIIIIAILYFGAPLMYHTKQNPIIIPDAIDFLRICAFSLLPLMIFQSYRQLSEGISMTVLVTIATIISNIINIILNYILIYGKYGFPKMGIHGSATATLIARIIMMIILIVVLHLNKNSSVYFKYVQWKKYTKVIFKKLTVLGLPTSLQSLFEISAFAASAFIAGIHSYLDISAHQIVVNLASLTFQICTGFAVASTIRIGNFYGLKDQVNMRKAGMVGIYIVTIFMFFCGILFILLRNIIPTIFLNVENAEEVTLLLVSQLMIIAALFQLFDGVQVVSLGCLRGLRDVKIPTLITFIAYWIIAIPIGYYLCVIKEKGAPGMWLGLCLGLIFSAICLLIRFNKITYKDIKFKFN